MKGDSTMELSMILTKDTPVAVHDPKNGARWPLVTVTILSALIALVSLRYLVPVIPIPIPPMIFANTNRLPWLLIHVAASATSLLLAPLQLFAHLRASHPAWHRWIGRTYVLGCTVGGISGLALAFGAFTGAVTSAGFASLAIAWLVTTTVAWIRAIQRRIKSHQRWMIRSFALTLAGVTLRVYLPIAHLLPFPYVHSYQAISFLCWMPNLIAAQLYIQRRATSD